VHPLAVYVFGHGQDPGPARGDAQLAPLAALGVDDDGAPSENVHDTGDPATAGSSDQAGARSPGAAASPARSASSLATTCSVR